MTRNKEKYDVSTHFSFGENWSDYSKTITQEKIDIAVRELKRFLNDYDLTGKTFLDIGSGSGLHALAALILGAEKVIAIDIDKNSTETTRDTLTRFAPENAQWEALTVNIFESAASLTEKFDIVYSWGVLHHTGDMHQAIEQAIKYLKPESRLLLALYVETPFCGIWKRIKWFYSKLHSWLQKPILWLYSLIRLFIMLLKGKNPITFVKNYHEQRGMNFTHDAHDWLGGYPYESISHEALEEKLAKHGFNLYYTHKTEKRKAPLGTGCGEYHFIRE